MPTLDAPGHPLHEALSQAFASQLERGDVDLVNMPDARVVEIQSDEWTLHLQGWPVTLAFLALDDEPTTLEDRQAALDAALDAEHIAALRHANRLLDNAIAAALDDSGDELSATLARAIVSNGHDDLLDTMGE
jgi:hypothetical protein